jgi:hypothetical protein
VPRDGGIIREHLECVADMSRVTRISC